MQKLKLIQHFLWTLILILIPLGWAQAYSIYLPVHPDAKNNIELTNSSSQAEIFFIQFRNAQLDLVEIPFEIRANSKMQIYLNEISLTSSWFLLKSNLDLSPKVIMNLSGIQHAYLGTEDLSRQIEFVPTQNFHQVLLTNLTGQENEITIEDNFTKIQVIIPPFQFKLFIWSSQIQLPIRIKGQQRFKTLVWNQKQILTERRSQELINKKNGLTYFIFGSPQGAQFSVGLENPEHIKKARELIKKPGSWGGILSARIKWGTENHNLNLPSHPAWSWQVDEVFGFYDLGSTECNGNAQLLEEIAPEWIAAERAICFWQSRPLRELN